MTGRWHPPCPPSPSRRLPGNPRSGRVRPEPARLSPPPGSQESEPVPEAPSAWCVPLRTSGLGILPGPKNLGAAGAPSWEKASVGRRGPPGLPAQRGLFSRLWRRFRCLTGSRARLELESREAEPEWARAGLRGVRVGGGISEGAFTVQHKAGAWLPVVGPHPRLCWGHQSLLFPFYFQLLGPKLRVMRGASRMLWLSALMCVQGEGGEWPAPGEP